MKAASPVNKDTPTLLTRNYCSSKWPPNHSLLRWSVDDFFSLLTALQLSPHAFPAKKLDCRINAERLPEWIPPW